jgi:hypothetical protein
MGYREYVFYQNISNLQKNVITLQNDISQYKDIENKNKLEIITKISENNQALSDDLNEKISNIQTTTNSNRTIVTSLRDTTNQIMSTNANSTNQTAKDNYTTTITELFNQCTGLLTEFASAADESTEAALTYHQMLEDQYNIVDKYNSASEPQITKDEK